MPPAVQGREQPAPSCATRAPSRPCTSGMVVDTIDGVAACLRGLSPDGYDEDEDEDEDAYEEYAEYEY